MAAGPAGCVVAAPTNRGWGLRMACGRQFRLIAAGVALLAGLLGAHPAAAQDAAAPKSLVIGTGTTAGIYSAMGSAICRLLARLPEAKGIACDPRFSVGSRQNVDDLRAGKIDLALVQSDVQHFAYRGQSIFEEKGPMASLRHIVTLHPEALTVVAGPQTGMTDAMQISGRRVNMGQYGSGTLIIGDMFQTIGFDVSKVQVFPDFRTALSAEALCRRSIDAFAFVAGHPNPLVQEAVAICGAYILPVDGPLTEELLETYPLYHRVIIPRELYRTSRADVPTLGVHATLVADARESEELIYLVTKALYEGLPELRRLHLAFAKFDERTLSATCNTAPLHPGAARYLAEAGLTQGPC